MITQIKFPFGTHQRVLAHAVKNSSGAVLEIGCGHGSTPMLHELCRGRKLVTLETDFDWMIQFHHLANLEHEFYHADNYEEFDELIRSGKWDVVFIDHAPAERRNFEIEKVTNAKFVVVHDTHDPAYEYEKVFPLFKDKFTYTLETPWTTVLSNKEGLSIFNELL